MDGDQIFTNWLIPIAAASILMGVSLPFLGIGILVFRWATGW